VAHTYNLATQETEIRRITVRSQPQANSSQDPISKKHITKKELVEWVKVKALSSNPSAAKNNKNKNKKKTCQFLDL
jgi:hypothetical protein